jgi:excisionase family DNA binding protein
MVSQRQDFLTPPEVANRLGVEPAKVISWIKRGELVAVDLVERTGGRPRYRIRREALEQFLERRSTKPPEPAPVRKRKPADGFVRRYYV